MLSETDPAGSAILFKNAINKYTEHECRLITTKKKYNFEFEEDLHIDINKHYEYGEVDELLTNADIFHFHILADENMALAPFDINDYTKGKKIVHHHHGHPDFRANPDKYRLKYKKLNRKVLVSTPDLLLGLPDAYWMPNLLPLGSPDYAPDDRPYSIISHSPTKIYLKNTVELLEAACEYGLEVDIIMNTPHKICLARKRKSGIVFDHLGGYYGMSSLEGLAMGKHVVADLDLNTQTHIKIFAETESLPWEAPEPIFTSLGRKLWGLRERISEMGTGIENREWMQNHWYPQKVVNRLIKFYETL